MILSVIQGRSGDRQNGVNLCTRKKETPKVPVPQTHSQSAIAGSLWVGMSQNMPWAPDLPWGWPGKGIAVICWSSFVVCLTPSFNTIASCVGGRAIQMWLYRFRADPSPKPVLFLSLDAWAKKPCRPEMAGSQTSLRGIRSHLGCSWLCREQEKKWTKTSYILNPGGVGLGKPGFKLLTLADVSGFKKGRSSN